MGYRLTELKLTNVDQNYVLTAEEDGDLSALISGNGGLTVTGGYAVTINGDESNTYTGSTVVEGQDTTVILAKTDALGETSGLTVGAGAGVEVQSGVSQKVGDLAGEGWVRLDAGSNFELAKNESAEIETDIRGGGIFTVDLGSADNVLQFTGNQSGFEGELSLTNGTFSLRSEASKDFADDAHIHLNDGANFDWSNGSNIGSLTIDGNNELTADTLVIGGAPSLTVDGNIVLNGNAKATAGVEVADNITLVDFDNLGGYDQSFIDSNNGSVTGTGQIGFTATGATAATGGQTITLGYTQGGTDPVANTTWLIADQLQTTGGNSLTSNVLLTGIEILGDLQIVGEAGEQKDLTAEITGNSGSITFTGGTIAVGAANRNNSYTAATTVAENTEVILQADDAFGQTSALTALGTVTIAQGVNQWIGDLSGNGELNLEDGSTLTLEKSGSAALGNAFAGSGTFVVDLGATNNALSFTNVDTANPFTGTFALSDLTFTLSQAQNAEIASGAKFVLQSGSVFDADETGNFIAGLTFDGGALAVGAVDLDSADQAKLTINGDLVVTGQGGTVSASGINLVGAADILQADDGVSQVVAHYTGNLVNDGVLTAGSFGESEIKNEANGTTVAYAEWAASDVSIDEADKNINLTTQLTAIELADTTTGLILDGTGGDISAVIRDHDGVAGTISFAGTGYVLSHENIYTGVTNVSGSVTAGADSAFGTTSSLNITGSGSVDLGNHSQTVGSLNIAENADLVGTGALTIGIAGGASQSQISGDNAFSGAVTLANGHTLTMNDAAGLGTSGTMSISDGSTLIFKGDNDVYGRDLEGSGNVVLQEGANITLTGSNADFTGDFSIEGNSTLTAAGTATDGKSADELLGQGGNVAIASGSTLELSQQGGQDWTIDNSLSGSGTVAVTGSGADEEFGFSSTGWGENFNGTLDLTDIRFVVGAGNTIAGNNAANMQSADANLQSGAVLEVQTGADAVDTFDALTLAGGTIQLDGTFGLNSSTTDQAKLVLDSLTIDSSSVLDVTMQESSGTVVLNGSLSQENLLLGSNQDAFETLIETNSTVQGFENLHLASGADSGDAARQAISNGTETVAYGIYDWELGLSQDQTDVGIGLTLTEVAIEADKTLVLTGADGADTLGVLLSGDDGNLEIASGTVHLTHTANGGNTYGGTTTVGAGATLTALAGGLGRSEWLTVGGTYENLGNNAVGGLTGSTGSELNLFENTLLTLSHADAATTSTFAGKLTGAGGLAYETGTLTITENAASDWTGQVAVGAQESGATLILQGAGALASGSIALLGEDSLVQILDDEDVVFANDVTGTGTLQVDLSSSDNSFTFATNQANLATGSGLELGNVRYELADGDDSYNLTIADKLNITVGSGAILSTDGEATKDVWGLTLSGGELYLGNVDNTAGQIHLDGNGTLTIDAETTISFAENETTSGDRYENGLTGGALLSGGGVFSLDIITGVTGLDGDVGNLRTDETFADSNEDYYQDIVEGGDPELVAKLYRGGDGKFFYDENRDTVYMTYGIRRIDLQWTGDDNGLTLNADGMNNAALDALVTGAGNIVFAGGNILVTGEEDSEGNTYTGATYVRDGAEVTLAIDNAFGETKLLQVDGTGSVHLQDGLSQTVGDVAGSGAITLGNGSTLTLDYTGTDGLIQVGNAVSYESTATNGTAQFVIDGEYAPTAGETAYAELDFTNQTSDLGNDLGNVNVELKNVTTSFDSINNDVNYQVLGQAAGITLGDNADLGISATSGGASQSYSLNKLVFNGGNLSFANATLSAAGSGTGDYVLDVGNLDVTNGGTLSVSAEIGSAFNILEADDDTYAQTLIHYGSLQGDVSNIGFNAESLDASEIRNAEDAVTAYVTWQGVGENGGVVHDAVDQTIGLEYEVDELQLALADDEGFVVQAAEGASGDDLTLSATITNYRDVAGTITYGGGDITVTGSNDYTGTTNVNAGTVTLGNALGFGRTQELNVVDGAGVDIAGYDVTLGALNLEDGSDFSGIAEANITLGGTDYAGTSSSVAGEHGYAGGIALTNGHTLTMTDAAGLGTSGVMSISEDSTLIFKSDTDSYGRDLEGSGNVVLQEKANITLAGSNADFTGDFSIEGNSTLVAAGTTTGGKSADELLGQGGNVAIASGSTLVLSEAVGGDWTIDNSVSGEGTLRVVGTNAGESFGFSTRWAEAFEGVLDLSDIRFAVGAGTTSENNAFNMASADAVLRDGSVLEVETADQAIDTFRTLTVGDGASVEFDGTFALNAQTSELGQLVVDELTLQAGANIVVGSLDAGQDGNADFGGTIVESSLFASSEGFQTLISQTAGSDIEVDGVLLNGQTGTATAEQRITSVAGGEVATGFYRYGLATNGNGATQSLGIGYDLYRVDIDKNQVLTLSENQTFDQQFTGSGGITIASGTGVVLAHSAEGDSTYQGDTKVLSGAMLTAQADSISADSKLIVSGTYENVGNNTVDGLDIETNGILDLASGTLTIDHADDAGNSEIDGTVEGSGALAVHDGTLTVNSTETTGYRGNILLGAADSSASMTLSNVAGLGTGTIRFEHADSKVDLTASADTTLTNRVAGAGTINVTLGDSGHIFQFANGQVAEDNVFAGTLNLVTGTYDLTTDAGAMANAELATDAGAIVVVNDEDSPVADRELGSLSLDGGVLNFGTMTAGSDDGQIVTDSFRLGEGTTEVVVSLGGVEDANGSSVFDAGTSLTLIEGYDGIVALDGKLVLSSQSGKLEQSILQNNVHVATFTYGGGQLNSKNGSVEAVWNLTEIALEDATGAGLNVSASSEETQSGTISALISGTGNITFSGGTVTVANEDNSYIGTTYVTGGTLELGSDNVLGQATAQNDLEVSGGTVNFGGHSQTLGTLTIDEGAGFSANGASITLSAGNSLIAGANNGATGTYVLQNAGTTLELNDALATGSMTISMGEGTTLVLDGFGTSDAYGTYSNHIDGGEVQIGGGQDEASAYVELTDHTSSFETATVMGDGHLLVNNVEGGLMFESLDIASGGSATLNGTTGWMLDEALTLDDGASLHLSAGGIANTINFSGQTADNIRGSIFFTDSNLMLGGTTGTGGASNADALQNATVHVGEGFLLTVATGEAAQTLDGLTFEGGTVHFDGTLGLNVGSDGLGRLNVTDALDLTAGGTVTVTGAETAVGTVDQSNLLSLAEDGTFEALITAGTIIGDADDVELTVDGASTVTTNIMDGTVGPVAEGTFSYSDEIRDSAYGVNYGLTAVNILSDKTLTLTEDGDFGALISNKDGAQSLTIAGDITLTNDENDYTAETKVTGGHTLTALKGALGHTAKLTVENGNTYINQGDNEVGGLDVAGTLSLSDGTVLTIDQTGDSTSLISGTLTGTGDLVAMAGELEIDGANEGYSGDVSVGTEQSAAIVAVNNAHSLGTGTVNLVNESSEFSLDAVSGASKTVTLSNTIEGDGVVRIAVNTENASSAEDVSFFSFNENQGEFTGTIAIDEGGYSLAYATDEEGAPYTANQIAARKAHVELNDGGKLFVSTNKHPLNRYIDKDVGSLTLAGGDIYFGGLFYTREASSGGVDGGQLQLGRWEGSTGALVIDSQSGPTTVHLGDGATNTLSAEGTEVLLADDGTKVDFIQGAASVVVNGQNLADLSEDERNALLNGADGTVGALDFSLEVENSEQEISQRYVDETGVESTRVVAIVDRVFGDENGNIFGIETNENGKSDLYLNYSVSDIKLMYEGDDGGLVVTGTSDTDTLSAHLYGSGNIVFRGDEESVIALGGEKANEYTGTTFLESGTIKFAADNAFGSSDVIVSDGATVDLGAFNQETPNIEAEGDDALAGTGQYTLTEQNGQSSILGHNTNFHGDFEVGGNHTLTIGEVDSLGVDVEGHNTSVTLAEDSSELVMSGVSGNFTTDIAGSGTVSFVADNEATADVIINTSDLAGFTGDYAIDAGSMLTLVNNQTDWNFSTEVSGEENGNGTLVFRGTGDFTFANANQSDSFEGGTYVFEGLMVAVGNGNANAKANESNLQKTNGVFDQGSSLVVDEYGATIGGLALDGGRVEFTASYTPGETAYEGSLISTDFTVGEAGGTVSINVDQGVNPDFGEGNESLTMTDGDIFNEQNVGSQVTLISSTAGTGSITDGEVGNLTLDVLVWDENSQSYVDAEEKSATVSILSDDLGEEVADGTYGFKLVAGNNESTLDLAYGLTNIAIYDGKKLELTGVEGQDNVLSATISDKDNGSGSLAVLGGHVELTNADNSYTGSTTVEAGGWLTASAGALGQTSGLTVETDGTYENAGNNTVGGIEVQRDGKLRLTSGTLTVALDADAKGSIAGDITGSGNLTVSGGTVTVEGVNTRYSGTTSVAANGTITANDIASLGKGTISTGNAETGSGTVEFDLGPSAVGQGYQLQNAIEGNGTLRIDLADAADGTAFNFANGTGDFTGTLELIGADFTLDASTDVNQSVVEQAVIVLGNGSQLNVGSDVRDPTPDFHDRYVAGLALGSGSTVSFGGLVYNPESNNKEYGGQLNLGGGDLDLSQIAEGSTASIHLADGATNYLGDGAELLVADDTAQINLFENIGDIVFREGDSTGDLNDYLALNLGNSESAQTIRQQIEDGGEYVEVASVHREFGNFGSALHDAEDGSVHEDVYVEYTIDELELTYTGDNNGLHVAASADAQGDDADLKMLITGDGNIVFDGGDIVVGAVGSDANTYTGATYVNGGSVTLAKNEGFGNTKLLDVESGATVDLGRFNQTVLSLTSDGELRSESGFDTTLKIGVADSDDVMTSYVNGANTEFHADVELLGSGHKLTVNDGAALGDGTVALHDNNLVVDGAGSASGHDVLTAALAGTGDVDVDNAFLTVDRVNAFTGSWTATGYTDLIFNASADDVSVSDLLGASGNTVVIGDEASVSMDEDHGWTLANNVSGNGHLHISAGGGEFQFADNGEPGADTVKDFTGTYHFTNSTLTLNDTTSNLAGDVSFESGATAVVGDGEYSLNDVAVENGGKLEFTGNIAPGHYDEENPSDTNLNAEGHISADSLTLAAGAQVEVDMDGLKVDPDDKPGENVQLTAQDVLSEDESGLLTVLVTTENGVSNNGAELVTGAPSEDSVTVDIVSNEEGVTDAKGTYDYALQVSEDGNELGISYKLTEVAIEENRTLNLSASTDGSTGLRDNTLTATLTGKGSLAVTGGHIVLQNGGNNYEGTTSVLANATLTATEGSLGENGLIVDAGGTYENDGDNTTSYVNVDGNLQLNNETTFTIADEASNADDGSVINGNLQGGGNLVLSSGFLTVSNGNTDYTGDVSVAENATLIARDVAAVGTGTSVSVEGEYRLDGVSGEVSNDFTGSGIVSIVGSNVTVTGDNAATEDYSGFTGTFSLENGTMTVNDATALGGANVSGVAETNNELVLDFAEDTTLSTVISGTTDVVKSGAGNLSLNTYEANGTFTIETGNVDFTSFGADGSDSTLVMSGSGLTASVAKDSFFQDLTIGSNNTFTIGGTSGGTSPINVSVAGKTDVGSGTLNVGVNADNATAGNVLTTHDFSIDGGQINLNGVLESSGWTIDHIVVNGTGSGNGSIFVTQLGEGAGGVGTDAWLVQAGEGGNLSDLDLTLVNEHGEEDVIDAGSYEWHLLEAENGAGYYLHAFNKGTGDIDGNEIREPAAGAQAALLMASQTAFDLSLHDHIGNTPYVDQLTGEKKLTSLWILQRGDWSEWDDMSGQLSTDGKVMTTTIGGDVKSWVSDAGYQVHLGLLGAYAQADFDVKSDLDNRKAHGEFTGWSVGGYAAFQPAGMDGAFGSLQVRWNRFDNEAGPSGEAMHEYTSDGFSIQGELGYTKTLSSFRTFGGKTGYWRIEPHVRAHWNGVSADSTTDDAGRTFSVKGDGNIAVRVGFRSTLDVTHSVTPTYGDPTVRAYVEANYLRNTKQTSVTMTNEFRTSTVEYDNSDMAEFRFGLEGQFNRHLNLWGDVHHVTGDDAYNSTGVMLGLKYNF